MIHLKKLSKFKNLIHGFTTKEEGDFKRIRGLTKKNPNKSQALAIMSIRDVCQVEDLVIGEQVHEDKIAFIGKKDKGKVIKGVDGLITKEKGVILGVTTADCLSILFYEPKKNIIAAAHAGWKSSLKRIIAKMVQRIKKLGGDTTKIIVTIGPHIHNCCYEIDRKRELTFRSEFGGKVIIKRDNKSFLDLRKINLIQLRDSGVKEKNIEISPFCTCCNDRLFFSYRKEKGDHGEMLSFIGMVKRNDEF